MDRTVELQAAVAHRASLQTARDRREQDMLDALTDVETYETQIVSVTTAIDALLDRAT